MKMGFIITGRMKSTRLKKKLTLKIHGREVIAWMIDRAKIYFKDYEIVIATSQNAQDDILEEIAIREGIKCYRGDEDDVIERLYDAAVEYNFDFFINITADCPLFGVDFMDRVANTYRKTNADLITSLNLPHGFFVYGLKTNAVKKVLKIKKTKETEVWGDYFYANPKLFNVQELNVLDSEMREGYRLTLDYPEDFDFFKNIFEHFGINTYKKTSNEILNYLDNNPHVVDINRNCSKSYTKRWESQRVSKIEKSE